MAQPNPGLPLRPGTGCACVDVRATLRCQPDISPSASRSGTSLVSLSSSWILSKQLSEFTPHTPPVLGHSKRSGNTDTGNGQEKE